MSDVTTQSGWLNDALVLNQLAYGWYQTLSQNQPTLPANTPGVSTTTTPTGSTVQISAPVLALLAIVVVAVIVAVKR